LILLLSCWTTHARAAGPDAEPFRLAWSTSANCGRAEAFLEELQARTARARPARAEEHAITFVAETFRSPEGVHGQLTIHRPGAQPVVRDVPGSTCAEVTSAMALIAALTVDPLASTAPREPNHALAGTDRGANQRRQAHAWSLRAEQRLTARTAVAPGWAWGQAVGLSLTREKSPLHPSLGVAFMSADATTRVAGGSAEFAWLAGQLTLCPLGLEPTDGWDLRACASLELGRLRGIGFATVRKDSKSIVWSSSSLLLELRRQLLGPLWGGAQGGLSFPFTREHFYIEPRTDLHRVPAWGGSFGVGLGLRFL
jgi:hypothetical protein